MNNNNNKMKRVEATIKLDFSEEWKDASNFPDFFMNHKEDWESVITEIQNNPQFANRISVSIADVRNGCIEIDFVVNILNSIDFSLLAGFFKLLASVLKKKGFEFIREEYNGPLPKKLIKVILKKIVAEGVDLLMDDLFNNIE